MITEKYTQKIWILLAARRELSNDGLRIVVALLVRWQIIFCRLVLDVQSSFRPDFKSEAILDSSAQTTLGKVLDFFS